VSHQGTTAKTHYSRTVPGRTPAWNGPFSLTTPPATPAADVSGLLIEYCLPNPIYLVDEEYWPSIHITGNGLDLEIHKPVSLPVTSVTTSPLALGNQSSDVYCTLVRISSSHTLTANVMTDNHDLLIHCLQGRFCGRTDRLFRSALRILVQPRTSASC
jgi:hypothetical protein